MIIMEYKNYCVYWVHKPSATDRYTEGYIGITKNGLPSRRKSHFKASKKQKTPFYDALKKYGNELLWEVLHSELTQQSALDLERAYRPTPLIGWNRDAGGSIGVTSDWYLIPENKAKFSETTSRATKKGIKQNDSRYARSQRAKDNWQDPAYRNVISKNFRGDKNFCFGKFSAAHPAFGHQKTLEGRRNIADANKKRLVSDETRKKISTSRIALFREQKAARLEKEQAQKKTKRAERQRKKLAGEFSGGNAPASKVSDSDRIDICRRRIAGESYRAIAEDYPVGLTGIRAICTTWGPKNGFGK